MKRGFVHLAFGLASLLTANATSIQAKDYPERPVRVIVPFPAGGAVDVIARTITQKLSDELGGRFYVENLPGAAGVSGTVTAAAAKADGHTILFVSPDFLTTPILRAKAPYDPFTSFAPLTLAVTSQDVVAVHESVPAKSMNELMALLAANPGKYSYAAPGYGSVPHLKGELLFTLSHNLAALLTLAGMSSAVTVLSLSQPHFAADGMNGGGHSIDFASFLTIGR